MNRVTVHSAISTLVLLSVLAAATNAQVWPNSPVFRDYRPPKEGDASPRGHRAQVDLFLLEREASSGDPLAQHELGIRYLMGRGVPADTVRSALWLQRSAERNYAPARYNYGLLLYNGWGVQWNPFEAYEQFRLAAAQGMPEAFFVVGIFHTDDLVVPQDWEQAYYWVSKAVDSAYEPALRAKEELVRRGHGPSATEHAPVDVSRTDTTQTTGAEDESLHVDAFHVDTLSGASWMPVLLDFSSDRRSEVLNTERLLIDLLASTDLSASDSLALLALNNVETVDEKGLALLNSFVKHCNPEAMLLLGQLHETGGHVSHDVVRAALWYLRASWHETPLAFPLLGRLLQRTGTREAIDRAAYSGNPDAQYVFAALRALEIDLRHSENAALDMLRRATEAGSSNALLQLGLWYASDRIVPRDMEQAISLWSKAAIDGNYEARLRLAAAALFGRSQQMSLSEATWILETAATQGSILAATAIARDYEIGITRSAKPGIAARMYRECAIRGSNGAYEALRGMHDAIRPDRFNRKIQD